MNADKPQIGQRCEDDYHIIIFPEILHQEKKRTSEHYSDGTLQRQSLPQVA